MIELINLPRGGGKTLKTSEWCLQNTKERAVVVGTQQQRLRLMSNGIPEKNIFNTYQIKNGLHLNTDIKELGVDEVGQVLNNLLEMETKIITGTFGGSND